MKIDPKIIEEYRKTCPAFTSPIADGFIRTVVSRRKPDFIPHPRPAKPVHYEFHTACTLPGHFHSFSLVRLGLSYGHVTLNPKGALIDQKWAPGIALTTRELFTLRAMEETKRLESSPHAYRILAPSV